jgi:hypothetical protein
MMDFIERLNEVGSLSCLVSIFSYIAYLRLEFISAVIFAYCGLPLAIERFSIVTELATILGIESCFRGLECFSPLISLVYIEFLVF